MSNSPLVEYTKISPHRTSPRTHKIDKITIHHMAGNCSIETCGSVFQSRKASSNYGIGTDGRVGMYVEEKDRSWASSNAANDHRAVTIEVANSKSGGDWPVSDKALAKLIELCVDICKRNGIEKLNFTGDKNGNLTMHKYFAATACPGPYLESKFKYIADEVNKRLGGVEQPESTEKSESAEVIYRIRKSWNDASSQVGAYKNLESAKKACPDGYTVYDEAGKAVYTKAKEVSTVKLDLPVLEQGSEGDTVKAVQRMLYALGYDLGDKPVDGSYGPKTVAAVKKYQGNKGLTADGVVGEKTWKSLLGV